MRAHQVFESGVKYFFDGKLVSVFSANTEKQVEPKIIRIGKNLQLEPLSL